MNVHELDMTIMHLLQKSSRLMMRMPQFHAHGDYGGMPRGQGRLLLAIYESGGMTNKDIVEKLDIRPSSANNLLVKLERAAFIEKTPHETDKRSSVYTLTENGKAEAEKLEKQLSLGGTMLTDLTVEEKEQLKTLLEKLCANMFEMGEMSRDEAARHFDGMHGGAFDNRDDRWFGHPPFPGHSQSRGGFCFGDSDSGRDEDDES